MKKIFAQKYIEELQAQLKLQTALNYSKTRGLGYQTLVAGVSILDLVKIHQHTLVSKLFLDSKAKKQRELIKKASAFFAIAMVPDPQKISEKKSKNDIRAMFKKQTQYISQLAAENLKLNLQLMHRKVVEAKHKVVEKKYVEMLKQSENTRLQLRRLSRQLILAQEEERRVISRELHDVIAQSLAAINIRLATLKKAAELNTKDITTNIASTQLLVQNSFNTVHQFARELRPPALDDLGLIPALRAYMEKFFTQTGIHVQLIAFADVESLSLNKRTALFRVVQEALSNVARHAHATHVTVNIKKTLDSTIMEIHDNGIAFEVQKTLQSRGSKRLGLLGMRERIEMLGGHFEIMSLAGKGTTIHVAIPLNLKFHKRMEIKSK